MEKEELSQDLERSSPELMVDPKNHGNNDEGACSTSNPTTPASSSPLCPLALRKFRIRRKYKKPPKEVLDLLEEQCHIVVPPRELAGTVADSSKL